jgi:acylphosphatase
MKLIIKITGPKVHDVGYGPYLTELAMKWALRGFEVFDDEENGQPVVIALLDGDDRRVKQFFKDATAERPPLAMVDKVTSSEYTGEVMPMWQAASISTATQINEAMPILMEIRDDLKGVKKNTDKVSEIAENTRATPLIFEEIKSLKGDIQTGRDIQLRQMQADIRAIKDRLGMP